MNNLDTFGLRYTKKAGKDIIIVGNRKPDNFIPFNLKSRDLQKSEIPSEFRDDGDDVCWLEQDFWMKKDTFIKILHVAALQRKTFKEYVNRAIEAQVNADLENHEDMGKLLSYWIKGEASSYQAHNTPNSV
jgi:hypothetical protein